MMKYIMTGLTVTAFLFAALTGRMDALSTAFLEECGGDNYSKYSEAYDSYFDTGEDETLAAPAGPGDGLTMM